MRQFIQWTGLMASAVLVAGCAVGPDVAEIRKFTDDFIKAGFQTNGQATVSRITQVDETNRVCSEADARRECLALASLPAEQRPKPISTGIPSLDIDMRGGVIPGTGDSTWVLAARSGVGKTTVGIARICHSK